MQDRLGRRRRPGWADGARSIALILLATVLGASPALAFRVIGSPAGWSRWDAAPRFVGGQERSLAGGLRYSIEHGDYGLLRDEFMWYGTPPDDQAFADAIARAFEHWEVVDPATGLPAAFHFVEDLSTPAVDQAPNNPNNPNAYLGLNAGAEIDIFAEIPHAGEGFGASVIFFVDTSQDDLTLTSGTPDYAGRAISGVDIRINPGFVWTLRGFETLLTHEIGHALGLADLEVSPAGANVSGFLDDDFDPSTSATVLATTSNSFALLIDPADPDASPLFNDPSDLNTDPGIDSPGVAILMESEGWTDLLYVDPKLRNDDFAGRQFLYPVPEPGTGGMLLAGGAMLALLGRLRRAGGSEKAR